MDYLYPKRPDKFFFTYMDVLFDERPAEDVSAAGFALLWTILKAEDRRGFRAPALFTNDVLCERLGLGSEDVLDKLRKKAVATGWLGYIPGGRGRKGQYWVLVPAHCQGETFLGHTLDEADETEPTPVGQSPAIGPLPRGPIAVNAGRSRELGPLPSGPNADQSADHSRLGPLHSGPIAGLSADPLSTSSYSLPKSPSPSPTPDRGGREIPDLENSDHAALVAAIAAVTANDPATDGGEVHRTAAVLLNAPKPYTAAEVLEFGRRWKEFCRYSSARSRDRPYPSEVAKHTAKVRAVPLNHRPPPSRITGVPPRPEPDRTAVAAPDENRPFRIHQTLRERLASGWPLTVESEEKS